MALPAAPQCSAGCCCPGTQPDLFSLGKVPGIPPGILGHGLSQEMDFPLPDIKGYANLTPLASGIGTGIDPLCTGCSFVPAVKPSGWERSLCVLRYAHAAPMASLF